MKKIAIAATVFVFTILIELPAQTSLIGGVNTTLNQDKFYRELRYFGGVEFKIKLRERFQLYFSPQYNELKYTDYQLRSAKMPLGIAFQVNEMWDEETILFRFIDFSIGGYGAYFFEVQKGEADITDSFSTLDYGLQFSTKLRLFIFYPMYVSINYGLAQIKEEYHNSFHSFYIQAGAYIPVSTLFKIY